MILIDTVYLLCITTVAVNLTPGIIILMRNHSSFQHVLDIFKVLLRFIKASFNFLLTSKHFVFVSEKYFINPDLVHKIIALSTRLFVLCSNHVYRFLVLNIQIQSLSESLRIFLKIGLGFCKLDYSQL